MDNEVRQLAQEKAQQSSRPGRPRTTTPTQIDRRQCHRIRPLEVLCLGRERTGTLSLRLALFHLRYYDVYHMSSLAENPSDVDLWLQAVDAKFYGKGTFGKADWDCLLGHCMAVSDMPAILFGEDLIEAYPAAKVILTVRDTPEIWHQSMKKTVLKYLHIVSPKRIREPGWNPLHHLERLLAPRSPLQELVTKMSAPHDSDRIPKDGVEVYLEHNEKVRRAAASRHFLEFNVKEGWAPLCEFLDKPVPDVPFPNTNDAAAFENMLNGLRRRRVWTYVSMITKIILVPVLAIGVVYCLR